MTKPVLYHATNMPTRSYRVVWTAAELGLDLDIKETVFNPTSKTQEGYLSPEFAKLNPLNRIPAFLDGDLLLTESGAICQYLLEKYGHGHLQPAVGSPLRGEYLNWVFFGEATMMPEPSAFFRSIGALAGHTDPDGSVKAFAVANMNKILKLLEHSLAARGPFLLGDEFTLADIMCCHSLIVFNQTGQLSAELYPHVHAYAVAVCQRPAVHQAYPEHFRVK